MTTTRYPGNPDFHEVPPRCADCGQFVGEPVVWEHVDNWDLPDTYTARCLECATDKALRELPVSDRDDAREAVLGAMSG